jgi:hypothetical protein
MQQGELGRADADAEVRQQVPALIQGQSQVAVPQFA